MAQLVKAKKAGVLFLFKLVFAIFALVCVYKLNCWKLENYIIAVFSGRIFPNEKARLLHWQVVFFSSECSVVDTF